MDKMTPGKGAGTPAPAAKVTAPPVPASRAAGAPAAAARPATSGASSPKAAIACTQQAVKDKTVQNCPLKTMTWKPPVREVKASEVKTTEDYKEFIRRLEQKYPKASGFEINRAVRQHFYSDDGRRNTHEVFDSWLGKEGGKNNPNLKGIEKDLEGLPSTIKDPCGRPINLAHQVVGVDTYYREKVLGEDSWYGAPKRAGQRFMLTNGGDYSQTIIGMGHVPFTDTTVDQALNYSAADQLNGNNDGLAMGDRMTSTDRLSTVLETQYPPRGGGGGW